MDNALDFLDHLILYEISRHAALPDRELARRLQCPRAALLERLEQLWQRGYVVFGPENRLSLTEKGLKSCIPLKRFVSGDSEDVCAPDGESFDWTGLYIPEPGWPGRQDNKSGGR